MARAGGLLIAVALVACGRDRDGANIGADPAAAMAPPTSAVRPAFVTRERAERAIIASSPVWGRWRNTGTTPTVAHLHLLVAPPDGCASDDRPCVWTFETVEVTRTFERCEVRARTGVVRCSVDGWHEWTEYGNAFDSGTDASP